MTQTSINNPQDAAAKLREFADGLATNNPQAELYITVINHHQRIHFSPLSPVPDELQHTGTTFVISTLPVHHLINQLENYGK